MEKENRELEKLREKIDFVDREIISLLEKRINIAIDIGILKKENSLAIFDEKREVEVLGKVNNTITNKNLEKYIIDIYKVVIEQSKLVQKDI
ncbi:chorismate mutase [Peptostreptococcus canis]|uniref:Chorismate mutase n=1 Tax=Peptostreptococcus canis TaxID=1159213 RepID=A0ABR6TLY6_9FIRM|nr:chorismate mutase [Peptostreptococcus canis]MBC2576422.1 chorismate mutase [Peptostreptococcus canis]MBP1998397.1 monofunctional chorismate mutase [Peptostreptococcus canis]